MTNHHLSADRLAPLRLLAESREREAAQLFAQAQTLAADREDKLAQLENYCEPELTGTIAATALLLNREAFRARLADAIGMQRRVVTDSRQRAEDARRLWLERRRELLVIDQLIERSSQRERVADERIAQRQMDEMGLRAVGGYAL